MFVLIACATINVFLASYAYKFVRRFGTSRLDVLDEQIGMNALDRSKKKAGIWVSAYVLISLAELMIVNVVFK